MWFFIANQLLDRNIYGLGNRTYVFRDEVVLHFNALFSDMGT